MREDRNVRRSNWSRYFCLIIASKNGNRPDAMDVPGGRIMNNTARVLWSSRLQRALSQWDHSPNPSPLFPWRLGQAPQGKIIGLGQGTKHLYSRRLPSKDKQTDSNLKHFWFRNIWFDFTSSSPNLARERSCSNAWVENVRIIKIPWSPLRPVSQVDTKSWIRRLGWG